MYSIADLRAIRDEARYYRLDASSRFWKANYKALQKMCNGAGPERWSEAKRKALTSALKRYEPCFAVHDVDYSKPHVLTQKEADKRLKNNMVKVWAKDFGFWRWFSHAGRTERLVIIPAVYSAVAVAGAEAWEVTK